MLHDTWFEITSVAVASERLSSLLETKTELLSLLWRECFNFLCYSHLEVRHLACRWRERAVVNALVVFPTELGA